MSAAERPHDVARVVDDDPDELEGHRSVSVQRASGHLVGPVVGLAGNNNFYFWTQKPVGSTTNYKITYDPSIGRFDYYRRMHSGLTVQRCW
jgi:hypothetical protein